MQLIGDALTVLGSRIGIAWDPANHKSFLVRHGKHPGIPLEIKAGIQVGDKTYVLPLTSEDDKFGFLDQGMTPTTMTMGGIDPVTGIHVKLTIRIPFRPRDEKFSTVPVVHMELTVDRLECSFRWVGLNREPVAGTLFLEFSGAGFDFQPSDNQLQVNYVSEFVRPQLGKGEFPDTIDCHDQIATLEGKLNGTRWESAFELKPGHKGPRIAVAWCVYDKPVLSVMNELCPFKYTEQFKTLAEVVAWAKQHETEIIETSRKVDGIFAKQNLGTSVGHLLSQTLHSWLLDSWWAKRPNGQDWFIIWEGTCYFYSTVDVEYTQGPFYLAFWPELLELELQEWPFYGKDGTKSIGERGKGTLYLSHDIGQYTDGAGQYYPHEMEVEENANYLLLAYVHWRRTGKDNVLHQHQDFIQKLMDFICACDTSGNGIPDLGCANTIDDASPAVQFGKEQIYLGVKAMAAVQVGLEMLKYTGKSGLNRYLKYTEQARQTVEQLGWVHDHYVVTLTRTKDGLKDPWNGKPMSGELEGWDAYHIYTANGLVLLDMVGYACGLSEDRLKQDIENAVVPTLLDYGCKHSSYNGYIGREDDSPVGVSSPPQVGWISMNMLRDIAGAYRGLDLFNLADRYWDWQCTTNCQQIALFFETFYGNNLHFYPRGVAVFGYLDAALGFRYDVVNKTWSFAPVRSGLQIPLLLFADWNQGTVPVVKTAFENGKLVYQLDGKIESLF